MAQLAANAAEIAALKVEKEALSQRVVKLEQELALAKLHRFAPRSEKHIDRLFNEAEEAAVEGGSEEDDVVELPDTGLPAAEGVTGKSGDAGLCRQTCRASVSNTTLLTIRRLPVLQKPIDNNFLEREIRVCATGRKSWLFSDTVDGEKASAVIYSLMLTCRALRRRSARLAAPCAH
jgi:hypothetical protein